MLDIAIIIILIIIAFIGIAWYANNSRKQRTRLLEDINNPEPTLGDSEQFGSLFEQELNQQTIDNERFEIDAEPTITLSDDAVVERVENAQIDIEPPVESAVATSPEPDPVAPIETMSKPEVDIASPQENAVENVNEWDMVIAFTVMARDGSTFSGKSVKATLESLDLHFGDLQIYHRQVPGLRTQSLFSVANILDPGTLNPDSFATMKTPGLLIFTRLPGPVNGLTLFDDLLDTAQKMADKLDGVLSDESRQAVSQSTIETMRSRILSLNLQLQAEQNHYNDDYSN